MKGIEINMGELFKKFLESREEDNIVEIPVGKVSMELVQKFKAWKRDKRYLDDQVEIEKERLVRECRRQMEEMFDDQQDQMNLRKKELWEEIYKELGIIKDEDDSFSINAMTGEITKEVKKTDLFGNKSHGIQ
jgi:hypothetical protein